MARRAPTYWKDWPDTSTNPSAADWADLEYALDAYAGPGRNRPVFFRAALTTGYSQTAADKFAQTGWTIQRDTDGAGHAGSATTGDLCTYTIPLSGRLWDIELHAIATGQTTGFFGGHVTRNNAANVTSNSIAGKTVPMHNSGENHVDVRRVAVPGLVAGDVLRWALFASVTTTVATAVFGVPTEIVIRDAGPDA